jgi:predicted DNA-binding WGR domain protein
MNSKRDNWFRAQRETIGSRAQIETTGFEPRERQQVTSREKDSRLRAQREATGYKPRERQQVSNPDGDNM